MKLVALDLDGTLIGRDLVIRPRVKEAISRMSEAGVHGCIVTGRMYRAAVPFARELGFTAPVVCYQGAVIAEAASGRFVREVPLANAAALRAYHVAKGAGYHIQFYSGDRFYVEARNRFAELYARISGAAPVAVASLPEACAGRDSTTLNLVTAPEVTPACPALMQRTYVHVSYVTP